MKDKVLTSDELSASSLRKLIEYGEGGFGDMSEAMDEVDLDGFGDLDVELDELEGTLSNLLSEGVSKLTHVPRDVFELIAAHKCDEKMEHRESDSDGDKTKNYIRLQSGSCDHEDNEEEVTDA